MNLVEMSLKVCEGSREHLTTFEVEGEGIEDEDVTFRISIKNLHTGQARRSQCVVQPCREDSDDDDYPGHGPVDIIRPRAHVAWSSCARGRR